MNYREYWWKCTKEALSTLFYALVIIGTIALALGFCALVVFLAMKYAEYAVPIFGEIVSIIIIIGLVLIFGYIGYLFFNYRHYKKYVKDGE